MTNSQEYDQAFDFSLSMLKRSSDVTDDLIQSTVKLSIQMVALQGNSENIDVAALVWDLQSRFNVRIGTGTVLESKEIGRAHV